MKVAYQTLLHLFTDDDNIKDIIMKCAMKNVSLILKLMYKTNVMYFAKRRRFTP